MGEGVCGMVFGNAVGLERAPVAVGFGRVQRGQPGRGTCCLVGGQVGDLTDDVAGLVFAGGSAHGGNCDCRVQDGGGQVQLEGGGVGAVFPKPPFVLQEDLFGRGAGDRLGGCGAVLQQGHQGDELQGECVVVA